MILAALVKPNARIIQYHLTWDDKICSTYDVKYSIIFHKLKVNKKNLHLILIVDPKTSHGLLPKLINLVYSKRTNICLLKVWNRGSKK